MNDAPPQAGGQVGKIGKTESFGEYLHRLVSVRIEYTTLRHAVNVRPQKILEKISLLVH